MAAMNPGISPIFRDPHGELTNRPPVGNDPGWELAGTAPVSGAGVDSINGIDGHVNIAQGSGITVATNVGTKTITISAVVSAGSAPSPTAPVGAPDGTLWYDTTNFRLMVRFSGSWIQV